MKTVLLVVLLCGIAGAAWSIADEEILAQMQVLTRKVAELEAENQLFRERDDKQDTRLNQLETQCGCSDSVLNSNNEDLAQNVTIEERVTLLELSMTEVQDEVAELEEEVGFLFDEQVIQDERIYDLEQETAGLDARVEVLEAGGGGGGNVTALEARVETLEGIASDHEDRLVAGEAQLESLTADTVELDGRVETLEGTVSDQEDRLTSVESAVEDLQTTDVELDARITDLEEGGSVNATTIAFHAVTSADESYPEVPLDSIVIFGDVLLNAGDGYDPATGVFTVPSGGDGYYFVSTFLTGDDSDYYYIDIRVNTLPVCTAVGDHHGINDFSQGACHAVVYVSEGDEIDVYYDDGDDSTPIYDYSGGLFNGFTAFRI